MDLVKIGFEADSIDARNLYDYVFEGQTKRTAFNVWFSRAVNKYDFEEGKDFQSFMIKSTGGRPQVDYAVTKIMAKELAMVSPTDNGKKIRLHFIKCEEIAREAYANNKAIRLAGIEVRKSLTDAVQDSGEQERMHGHGYSTYTNMVYSITGLTEKHDIYKAMRKAQGLKPDNFRSGIFTDELKRVELAESMIKPLLELDKQYNEIKDTLKPLFERKEIG